MGFQLELAAGSAVVVDKGELIKVRVLEIEEGQSVRLQVEAPESVPVRVVDPPPQDFGRQHEAGYCP